MMYKIIKNQDGSETITRTVSGGVITFSHPSPGNADWDQYIAWLDEGNMPEISVLPEPVITVLLEDRLEALELIVLGIIS